MTSKSTDHPFFTSSNLSLPIVAILRYIPNVSTEELTQTTDLLIEAGIHRIEITLNTGDAIACIQTLAQRYGEKACIGAGTVLRADQVAEVQSAGGQFIVSPNTNKDVIAASRERNMISVPGAMTPTEVFRAFDYGADMVKIFPAAIVGPHGVNAIRAVLPPDAKLIPTGVTLTEREAGKNELTDFFQAGVWGVGLLNSPPSLGTTPDAIGKAAHRAVELTRNELSRLGRLT